MNLSAGSQPSSVLSALLLLAALVLTAAGCQNTVWVFPEDGSVQEGPFDVQVFWLPEMVASTLHVAMNGQEITGRLAHASMTNGALGMMLDPRPGRKLLTAQLSDTYGVPYVGASIFTATSTASREEFAGGLLTFECEDSFLNSPIQIPGFDLDLGLSEKICRALPIRGLFPSGDAAFPVREEGLPVLFGVFPKRVSYDVDEEIPNGISMSPVELGLSFPFDPKNPSDQGKPCRASFVMEGTILPGYLWADEPSQAVMVQSLREVSLSLVSAGECEHIFTSPEDLDLMTFNYVARK